jgi:hypothetical protein
MKFRKKPVVIEAVQWFDFHNPCIPEVHEYDPYDETRGVCDKCRNFWFKHGCINTLENNKNTTQIVCPRDWIITGVKGEKYPCKPDIFEMTYEKVG